jgi:hypothetical protein
MENNKTFLEEVEEIRKLTPDEQAEESRKLPKLTERNNAGVIGTTSNGYTVLKARRKEGAFTDSDCFGVALAKSDKQYVTWQFHIDGEVRLYWGHYFDDEESALADYEVRV